MPNASELLTKRSPVVSREINGYTFFCKRLSLEGRLSVLRLMPEDHKANAEFCSALLVASVCDEAGQPLLTKDQIPDLINSDSDFIEPMLSFVMEVNNFTSKSADEAKKN